MTWLTHSASTTDNLINLSSVYNQSLNQFNDYDKFYHLKGKQYISMLDNFKPRDGFNVNLSKEQKTENKETLER